MVKVFISHAKEDRAKALVLFDRLQAAGFSPWFDEYRLLPGDQWEIMIKKTIAQSDICILCLSEYSNNKVGYVQVEQKIALEISRRYPATKIFLVPVKLAPCTVPTEIEHYHSVNCFGLDDIYHLIAGLKEYFRRENADRHIPKNYFRHFKLAFEEMEPEKLKRTIWLELQHDLQNPVLHLLYALSCLKGLELSSLSIGGNQVTLAEQHLPAALSDPLCRSTALLLKAFIHYDFYERRHRTKHPNAKILFQEIISNKQLPDEDLIQHLKFSTSFAQKVKILLQWLKH